MGFWGSFFCKTFSCKKTLYYYFYSCSWIPIPNLQNFLSKSYLKKHLRSSLIYNTSARHERHECDTSATRETWVWYKCDTSATRTTRVRYEWKILILIATRVKTFSHPYIYYMANEKLQGEDKQFHSMNYLLEMACFYTKMRLKSAPQKLNFLMAKATSKSCTLDCSCKCSSTFPHSYAQ